MNYRRSFAAVGLASAFALAACGAEEQVVQPAAEPAGASQDASEAFQYYYDITHSQPAGASQDASEAFQYYYDITHSQPQQPAFNGDAKDHPGYGGQVESPAFNGDAKDHPGYGGQVESPAFNGDAKDHPGYGQIEPAGSQVLALRVSTNLEDQRASMQVELAALADREGLTGLSPAFLQRVGRTLVGNPR
jgi:hypothetical protein